MNKLEKRGLPDNANHEMHEDYIMWHHWTKEAEKARKHIADLEAIAVHGVQ